MAAFRPLGSRTGRAGPADVRSGFLAVLFFLFGFVAAFFFDATAFLPPLFGFDALRFAAPEFFLTVFFFAAFFALVPFEAFVFLGAALTVFRVAMAYSLIPARLSVKQPRTYWSWRDRHGRREAWMLRSISSSVGNEDRSQEVRADLLRAARSREGERDVTVEP
jgi:hypothetical protein